MPHDVTDARSTVESLRTSVVAAVALAALTGCSAGSDPEQAPSPETEVSCPVTSPTAPERHPDGLRQHDGSTDWYGSDGLWVDLGNFEEARLPTGPAPVRVKHAWWTGYARGDATDQWGPPRVRAVRLNGDGEVSVDDSGGYARADGFSWWPTVLDFPARGCWEITGELHGTTVRFVVEI